MWTGIPTTRNPVRHVERSYSTICNVSVGGYIHVTFLDNLHVKKTEEFKTNQVMFTSFNAFYQFNKIGYFKILFSESNCRRTCVSLDMCPISVFYTICYCRQKKKGKMYDGIGN